MVVAGCLLDVLTALTGLDCEKSWYLLLVLFVFVLCGVVQEYTKTRHIRHEKRNVEEVSVYGVAVMHGAVAGGAGSGNNR